ncbi:hypothetical protein [Halomonas tibetensis]|uniref:Uncharacterized protein n=1 Tax=Halomonas tibetensis TaxID=2259590 RepID=A0ABV7B577_9GAMM
MRLDPTSLRLFVRVAETGTAEAEFIYHPLLGNGTVLEIAMAMGSGVLGIIALIGALFDWQSLKHRQAAGTPARPTPDKEPAR